MSDSGTPPPVDFRLLVASFTHQAMAALGKLPHPATGETKLDLPWARYFIDLLAMLEAKTKGNLEDGERAALEGNLSTLRLNFVDVSAENSASATTESEEQDSEASDGNEGTETA